VGQDTELNLEAHRINHNVEQYNVNWIDPLEQFKNAAKMNISLEGEVRRE